MFVRDWMTATPVTIDQHATLADGHAIFDEHGFRHLPVTGDGGVVVGIITLADLMSGVLAVVRDASDQETFREAMRRAQIGQYMNRQPISVDIDETLETAAALMREYKIGALPVLDGGNLVGIVTETDVFGALVDALALGDGGARMVHELEDADGTNAGVAALLTRLGEKGLQIASLVTYHDQRGSGKRKLVIRARGADG